MADLPAGVYDLLDSGFATSDIFDLDKVNRDADGNLIGALPDSAAANRPSAELMNGTCAALRQASTFFRGTAEPTAMSCSGTLRMPRYTTAGRPAAGTAGRLYYDTTLNLVFFDNGSAWVPAAGLSYNFHTATGPTATTDPTAILSQSIAASTLSSDGQMLDVSITGTILNTSGSNQSWEIAISLGGVELFRDSTGTFTSSATVRPYTLRFSIIRLTSTTCFLGGTFVWQTATSTPDTGLGQVAATQLAAPISSAIASPTVAWGSAQTLAVTVTCTSNHASTNFLCRSARIAVV